MHNEKGLNYYLHNIPVSLSVDFVFSTPSSLTGARLEDPKSTIVEMRITIHNISKDEGNFEFVK